MTSLLETFIEDDSNKMAFNACKAIINSSKEGINPLWLSGESGCGKTHLLEIIYHNMTHIKKSRCICLTAKEFIESIIKFYQKRESPCKILEDFDVILIDNLEDLVGMTNTQEEVAITLLAVCREGKQVAVASSCPPESLDVMSRLLREIGENTLFADIKAPSEDLRKKFIISYIDSHSFGITDEAVDYLSKKSFTLPQLKGILLKAEFWAKQKRVHINKAWINKIINDLWE